MAAPTSPDDNLDQFFAVFTSGDSTAQKITALMNLFCQNDNAAHPTIPAVGITHHGTDFIGVADVTSLWNQFFTSFDNFKVAAAKLTLPGHAGDVQGPRLYSPATYPTSATPVPMIGVQTFLSGDFVQHWFSAAPHNSHPLSGINPVPAAQNGPLHTRIPASLVFAYDSHSHLITNLWAYLDRYKLTVDLNPGSSAILAGFSKATADRQDALAQAGKDRRKSS
jgi:hypothetical protein